MSALSEVGRQVMWNRLIAVVEEQAQTLIRAAFSTSVREAGDVSAGVFDRHGRMLAQAVTGTPGHVNAMAEAIGHFIREIGSESIFEGDVYITNDPWKGTGHLHDITMVTPSFYKEKLVGFFAATAHVVDIGGRGFGPDANEIYEEGLRIPIMKFVERGELNAGLITIIRNNVRMQDQVLGDIFSLVACNQTGHARLLDTLREFAIDDLEAIADFIFTTSRRITLERIAALPKGTYRSEMTVDGYDAPVEMQAVLTIDGNSIKVDFAGTSGTSRFGINVPMIYTRAYSCYALKCAVAPDVPNNAASLEPFEVTAPEGCILNAVHPAPVSSRHVIGHLAPDVVLGALHQCLPDRIPAEGASALWNIHISARPVDGVSANKPAVEVLMFNSGGTGARPGLDGLSATAFPSGVHCMSVEATEHVGPIVVWRKELRPSSGGAGRLRGGLGQIIEIGSIDGYAFHFNAMFDRVANPARGRSGGSAGGAGVVRLADNTPLRGKGRQFIAADKRLVLELPGGGGFGEPRDRERDAVRRDLAAGYISAKEAADIYGLDETR